MTSQQLQSIILVALIANGVLIAFALLSARASRSRGGHDGGLDLEATHETMLAMAAAGPRALGSPATATMDQMERNTDLVSSGSSNNGSTAALVDVDEGGSSVADSEPPEDAVVLLDPLTGLDSSVAWRRAVGEEVPRLERYRRTATVMLVELDGFERLAERLGEAAGARVEVATARTLRVQARASDRCARLGRGRFAILLPETDEIEAINFGERVRAECDRWLEAGEVALRLAIGWAVLDPTRGAAPAIAEAERRLDAERRQAIGSAT